jgi:antirestriction protein ArdC
MTKKEKRDIYQEVTDRIVESLDKGIIPWKKPWKNINGELPYSLSTGKPYRGINVFLLAMQSYGDPRWGTYKATTEAGGQVRKGEKGTRIILWKPVKKKGETEEEKRDYLLLRDYVVFNAEQCDGLPELPKAEELPEHERDEVAEEIIKGYLDDVKMIRKQPVHGPKVTYGGDRACYSILNDSVRIPQSGQFEKIDEFYGTVFHELVHSTGNERRLARIEPALFGTDPYAKEELVAEIGASMLSGIAGLESAGGENSVAYIANWRKQLSDDPKLIIQAAAQAQKAADMILGTTFEEKIEDDNPKEEKIAA